MPRWSKFLFTNPEVDDDDLPLPEHRIFDDNGNYRSLIRISGGGRVSARRDSPQSAKRQEALLTVVGKSVKLHKVSPKKTSAKSSPAKKKSETPKRDRSPSPSKQTTPVKRNSVKKSPAPVRPSFSKSPSKKSSSPKKAATPKKSVSPKRTAAKRSVSKSPKRAAVKKSVSPKKKTASPHKKKASPKKKAASKSKSSASKRATPTATPSPKWTVNALKAFAGEHSIDVKGLRVKSDILSAIQSK